MRALLATLLLALLTLLPAGVAQSDALAPLAEDPTGDVRGTPLGGPTQPISGFDDVDLTHLWLVETPTTFDVRLRFAHMDGEAGPDQPSAYLYFTFDGAQSRIWLGRSTDNEAWFGSWSTRASDSASFRYVGPLNARFDAAAGEVWTTLDRDLVQGTSGRAPGAGDELTDIHVVSWATLGHSVSVNDPTFPAKGYLVDVGDRVPDADGRSLTLQYGGAHATGGLSLHVVEPYRASNGAATTYRYDLEAGNQGDHERTLTLTAFDVPAGWNVSLPGASVNLAAGASVSFSITVATPFRHQHGASESLQLRLADANDAAAWAHAELGVHYLAVAQPSGHHPTLFLHTHPWSETAALVNPPLGGTTGIVTMNTLEEDSEDAGVPIAGYSALGSTREVYGWAACLDPGLAMGLDFDPARQGRIRIPVSSDRPIAGAVLTGRLLHVGPGLDASACYPSSYRDLEVTELALLDASDAAQVGPAGEHTFETTLTAKVDRVPYVPGASLVLELLVTGEGPGVGGAAGLTLQRGGQVDLPLEEYADSAPLFGSTTAVADGVTFRPAVDSEPKDAPGLGLGLLLVLLAAVACASRR